MIRLTKIRGVIRGRTIELDETLAIPDGQTITMTVTADEQENLSALSRANLEAAAGAWADESGELDQFLEQNRQGRKISRREIEP